MVEGMNIQLGDIKIMSNITSIEATIADEPMVFLAMNHMTIRTPQKNMIDLLWQILSDRIKSNEGHTYISIICDINGARDIYDRKRTMIEITHAVPMFHKNMGFVTEICYAGKVIWSNGTRPRNSYPINDLQKAQETITCIDEQTGSRYVIYNIRRVTVRITKN
jgi:hypothetical protein